MAPWAEDRCLLGSLWLWRGDGLPPLSSPLQGAVLLRLTAYRLSKACGAALLEARRASTVQILLRPIRDGEMRSCIVPQRYPDGIGVYSSHLLCDRGCFVAPGYLGFRRVRSKLRGHVLVLTNRDGEARCAVVLRGGAGCSPCRLLVQGGLGFRGDLVGVEWWVVWGRGSVPGPPPRARQ